MSCPIDLAPLLQDARAQLRLGLEHMLSFTQRHLSEGHESVSRANMLCGIAEGIMRSTIQIETLLELQRGGKPQP